MKKKNEIAKYDANILQNIGKEGEMLSLTDLWKAVGSPKGKDPAQWIRQDNTQQLIETVTQFLNMGSNLIIKSKRGKSGGSFAHKNIALAYAKYLDPALHVLVNEVFFQRIEEEKNPDLIVDRAIQTYKRKGKTDEWIAKRIKGKVKRNEFTSCLQAHGVEREGFRNCTNAIYGPMFGGTTAVIREKKNLPEKASIRDNMSETELLAVEFAEHLSKLTIEKEGLYGNDKCEMACARSSRIVAYAVKDNSRRVAM